MAPHDTDPHDPKTPIYFEYGNLSDSGQLTHPFYHVQPEEIYLLGAQSYVRVNFDGPKYPGILQALELSTCKKVSEGPTSCDSINHAAGVRGTGAGRGNSVRCFYENLMTAVQMLHFRKPAGIEIEKVVTSGRLDREK